MPNIFTKLFRKKGHASLPPLETAPLVHRRNLLLRRGRSGRSHSLRPESSKLVMDRNDDLLYVNSSSDESLLLLIPGNDQFDHHPVNEPVQFPSLNETTTSTQVEDEGPLAGLTFESFNFPNYIRVSRRNKHLPRVGKLFLAQELNYNPDDPVGTPGSPMLETGLIHLKLSDDVEGHPNEMLVMEFSKDGLYLAAAGRDHVVRVWKVLLLPLARLEHRNNSGTDFSPGTKVREHLSYTLAPVFHSRPVAVFNGHSGLVISLDWLKNNFLLTGSMDKTAKLWHPERPKCLQTFQLQDFVTAVRFHPTDDRFFVLGSIDNRIMLWLILEGTVSYQRFLADDILITAVTFTPDGDHIVIGGFNGLIVVVETKGLEIMTQVELKERSLVKLGHHNGNKITGIEVYNSNDHDSLVDPAFRWNFLITTNDSKIRLVTKKRLVTRFKGLTNQSLSIVALTSDDGNYIILGLEDHEVYIWLNDNRIINNRIRQTLKDLVNEGRHLHERHLKDLRGYPRFVRDNKFVHKLLSPDHETEYANENSSYSTFHPHHTRVNVAKFAPESTKTLLESLDDIIYDLYKRGTKTNFDNMDHISKCKGGEVYQNQDIDNRGMIIVTTDQSGLIRVYRQDIAYCYRRKFISLHKQCMFSATPQQLTIDKSEIRKSLPYRSISPSGELHRRLTNRLRSRSNASTNGPASPGSFSMRRDDYFGSGATTIEQKFASTPHRSLLEPPGVAV